MPATYPEKVTQDSRSRYLGVALALSRLGVHITRTFTERLGPLGLSTSQAAIVRILGHHDHVTQQEVADLLGFPPARAGELIDELRGANWVEIGDEQPDSVSLSRSGRELYARLLHEAATFEAQLLSVLTEDEASSLFELLRRVEAAAGLHEDRLAPETLAASVRL